MSATANFEQRPYRPADWPAVANLLTAARPPARQADYPSRHDLEGLLQQPAIQAATRLWWAADGQLAAYAFVDKYGNLRFDWLPALAAALAPAIVAWGCAPPLAPAAVTTPCVAEDELRLSLLSAQGFVARPERTLYYARSLADPVPPPALPAGYQIRPYTAADCAAWVALHRAAFGTEYMTEAERAAMCAEPGYVPALDVVAVTPAGELAAYCLGGIDVEANALTGRREGYTDPVATHPSQQRRGLARALIAHTLNGLRQLGLDTALLGTSSDNRAMRATAAALGFSVRSAKMWLTCACQSPAPGEQNES